MSTERQVQLKNSSNSKGKLTFDFNVHFQRERRSAKVIQRGKKPKPNPEEVGRIPHVSKLMALALRMEALLKTGQVENHAEFAQLGMITTSRVYQIMNMLLLATSIQEELLFLPRTLTGRHPISERDMREIARTMDWKVQQSKWELLKKRRKK